MTVYFIQAGTTGPVKIGVTKYVGKRLLSLQCAHYEPLILIRKVEGYYNVERYFHSKFEHLHIRGEWFRFSPEMLNEDHIPVNKDILGNESIISKVKEIKNMAEVGRIFGISRERVRQIVRNFENITGETVNP